jgi:hypothetical protein
VCGGLAQLLTMRRARLLSRLCTLISIAVLSLGPAPQCRGQSGLWATTRPSPVPWGFVRYPTDGRSNDVTKNLPKQFGVDYKGDFRRYARDWLPNVKNFEEKAPPANCFDRIVGCARCSNGVCDQCLWDFQGSSFVLSETLGIFPSGLCGEKGDLARSGEICIRRH